MKTRDWMFLIVFVVVVVMCLRPTASEVRRGDGFFIRAVKWVALFWSVSEQPPAQMANYQSIPHAVMNAPPERATGADGFAQVDNGDGW